MKNDEAARQGRPAITSTFSSADDSRANGVTLRPHEARQLRALIAAAWPHRHTGPDGPAREYAEAIVEWHELLPLARGEVTAVRRAARAAVDAELERQRRIPTVDELVDLLRRTSPDVSFEEAA